MPGIVQCEPRQYGLAAQIDFYQWRAICTTNNILDLSVARSSINVVAATDAERSAAHGNP
jgi:hypothetical protein